MKAWPRTASSILIGGVLLASLTSGKSRAQEDDDEARRIVVRVTGVHRAAPVTGSGIIFGVQGDHLLVVTANHVARPGDATQELRVQFASLKAEPLPAILLDHHSPEMDIAVLAVPGAKERGVDPAALPFDKLGEVEVLKPGGPVYLLGYPDDNQGQVTPDEFSAVSGDRLLFASGLIKEGYSGGALLNEHREIVGMLLSKRPPGGAALAMPKLLETLRGWGYPAALRTRFLTSELETLSVGPGHSCRLLSGGEAYCWGANLYGRLGTAGNDDSPTPTRVEGGVPFVSIAAGRFFTCGLATTGTVYCWGSANGEWVGQCVKAGSPIPLPLTGDHKFRSLSAGDVYACRFSR